MAAVDMVVDVAKGAIGYGVKNAVLAGAQELWTAYHKGKAKENSKMPEPEYTLPLVEKEPKLPVPMPKPAPVVPVPEPLTPNTVDRPAKRVRITPRPSMTEEQFEKKVGEAKEPVFLRPKPDTDMLKVRMSELAASGIDFTKNTRENRRKFLERCERQIQNALDQIEEWREQKKEYESLLPFDNQAAKMEEMAADVMGSNKRRRVN